ncbi:MAG: RNA polymerase sigma factor, partial [Myxococcota bacterium]
RAQRPILGRDNARRYALPRSYRSEPRARETRSDRDLLAGIRRSDEADFTLLYERYFQRVYHFAYARLRNHADSEEVVQETFTVVFRSIDAYRGDSSLVSWIYGIAKNTVNNHLRRAKTHELRLERAEPELLRDSSALGSCTPEDNANLRRCADAIEERLASVGGWQAETFVLRHMENLSIGEIAQRMSRSNDAVRSSLCRVKRMVLEAVDPDLGSEARSAISGGVW